MTNLPIALQLYSVRDDMARDFAGTLKKVKSFGYDGVEFAGLFGHTAAEVRTACAQAGLIPISAHVSLDEILSDPEKTLSTYRDIGVKFIALPYLNEEYRPGHEKEGIFFELVKKAAALCKEYGIQLLYHNHDFEFDRVADGRYFLDALYESVDAELLKTQLDVCWVRVGGEPPVKYIEKYAGRAPLIHLKDYVGTRSRNMYQLLGVDDKPQSKVEENQAFGFRPVGYGVQDIPSILDAGEKAGAAWFVVEQDQPALDKPALENVRMSIEYLHNQV